MSFPPVEWTHEASLPLKLRAADLFWPPVEDYDLTPLLEKGRTCDGCSGQLEFDKTYYGQSCDELYCEHCFEKEIERIQKEAEEFAQANCRFERELEKYDPRCEFRPTPEEYATGMRESYTPTSYLCHCRHHCTNYDALLKEWVGRGTLRSEIYYLVIKDTIFRMIVKRAEEMEDAEDDLEMEDPDSEQ